MVSIHHVDMKAMPRIPALILGLSLAAGCSKSSPDTAPPDDGSDDDDITSSEHAAAEQAPMRVTGVYLDPALTAVCELDTRDELVEFDSEASDGHVDGLLARVAECVKTGPLKGRRIELVGHAKPGDEYRETFGSSRADAVRGALLKDGLKADDIVTRASDPEDDPDAAAQWPSERRVDVRVATRHAK